MYYKLGRYYKLGQLLQFGAKQATNVDPDKYVFTDHDIGFDSCSEFSLADNSLGKTLLFLESI